MAAGWGAGDSDGASLGTADPLAVGVGVNGVGFAVLGLLSHTRQCRRAGR